MPIIRVPGRDSTARLSTLEGSEPQEINGLNVGRIRMIFQQFDYTCQVLGRIRGISGNLHQFDFVCTRVDNGEKLILCSLLPYTSNQEAMEVEVVKLRLKTYDCSPDICLVVSAAPSNTIKELASLYKLTLVDIGLNEDPYRQIESLLCLLDERENRPVSKVSAAPSK